MKRKLFAFSMTLALLLSMLSVASVGAHTITIENTGGLTPARTDWFGIQPDVAGIGAIQRNNAQQGEFVFNDASRDQRLIQGTTGITRSGDIDWVSVTADANKIYFLTKVERYNGITQNPSINLIITIDTGHVNGNATSGGTLAIPVGTGSFTRTVNVPNDAAWEYAINAQFKPGSTNTGVAAPNKLLVFTTETANKSCGNGCSGQLVSAAVAKGSFVELSIPWASINSDLSKIRPSGAGFLRFTVSTTYNNLQIPTDGYSSPLIDAVGIAKSSTDILDGAIDTSFDVHFDTNAPTGGAATYEPYAPLLISEFQANPVGKDTPGSASSGDSEWIEIYNPNKTQAIPLADYKIGNAATRSASTTSSQGMYRFKGSVAPLAPGGVLVVARSRADFLKAHPGYAGRLLDLTGDFTKYTPWASGNFDLDNIGGVATEDQVVLLDAKDTIIDMVTYGNPTTPTVGTIPIRVADVPESVSYERCPAGLDTNGGFIDGGLNDPTNNTDFVTHGTFGEQTPGVACAGVPGLDNTIAKRGPETATVGTDVPFEITYSNRGPAELPGNKATITDTLPIGMTFKEAATPDGIQLTPVVNGQVVVFTVDPPASGGLPTTIVLTGTIAANAPQNTALTNRVVISSPNEQKDATTNNQAEWTVITAGPALLNVAINPVSFAAPPGRNFSFTINYGNGGQSVADGIQIKLDVPAGVIIKSVNSGGATPTFPLPVNGPTQLTWTVDQLDAIQNGSITVNGTVATTTKSGASLPFKATISTTTSGVASATGNATLKAEFIKVYLPMVRK